MCADEATIVWFLVGPPTCLFPCTLRGLAHRPSPNRTDTLRFSLPSGKLFYRVPSIRSLPCTFVRGNYLLGFLPSSRHHHIPPNTQTFHCPLASPPVLSTVRRLLQCDLRACFIPQPSSGHLLVQGFVHFMQHSILVRLITPLPLSSRTLTCKQAATHERLDFDVLLHTKPLSDRFGN